MGLPSTKCLSFYWSGLLQLHICDGVSQWYIVHSYFTHLFNFLEPFYSASVSHWNQIHSNFTYFATNIKLFLSKRIMDIFYNSFRTFLSSSFTSTRIVIAWIACITWIRMKSCAKFLCILVTTVHFTEIETRKPCIECWINWSIQ